MQSSSSATVVATHAPALGKTTQFLLAKLFAPVDIASLVFFRISIGLIFLVSVVRYFAHGWIQDFLYPELHFTYYGFGWVKPWPLWGLYAHFIITGLASLGLMLGFFYRISAALCFVGLSYIFLLEQSDYLNHFYLICLLALLMIFIPAHRRFSLDAWRKPKIRSDDAPAWARGLLLAQLSIVYFYAGIAKLNPEWLSAAPLRVWLSDATDVPLIGNLLATEFGYRVFAYGGLAYDLLIVPLLFWKRTRLFAYIWGLAFHLLNFAVFDIGVFPWMMMLATLLYFPPEWPRRWFRWRRLIPRPLAFQPGVFSRTALACGLVYLLIQAAFPFRHLLYPGKVDWTEEGHRFAWRMMLNSKNGTISYVITDPVTKQSWEVDVRRYLTRSQYGQAATCPDMILQMAHHLSRAEAAAHNYTNPLQVRAISRVSLNGRPKQPMIDPTVNLAAEPRNLKHAHWILPFKETSTLAAAQSNSTHTNKAGEPATVSSQSASSEDLSLLRRKAEQGDSSAQYEMALNCLHGRGVATNVVHAMKWATLAGRQSHPKAMELQDELRITLTPFQMALARRLVSDAAEKGETK